MEYQGQKSMAIMIVVNLMEKLLFLGINQNNCKSRNDTLCIKIRKKIYLDLTWKRSNKEICCCWYFPAFPSFMENTKNKANGKKLSFFWKYKMEVNAFYQYIKKFE